MADAPYCNVAIATPVGNPAKARGMLHVPPSATPDQISNIINQNFTILSKGNFVEDRSQRVTETVRIFDPSGSGAYIDVAQVKSIHLTNPLTGQTVVWKR